MKQKELNVVVLSTAGSSNKLLKILKLSIIKRPSFEFFKEEIKKVLTGYLLTLHGDAWNTSKNVSLNIFHLIFKRKHVFT